jgi:hypothetical protein
LWRRNNTRGGTNAAADQRTGQRAWTTPNGGAKRCATAGANQRAACGPLAGTVRVGACGYREHQAECGGTLQISADDTGYHWDPPLRVSATLTFPRHVVRAGGEIKREITGRAAAADSTAAAAAVS